MAGSALRVRPLGGRAPEHDCFRIDRGVTRYAIRGDRHALESDGRSSTSQSTKSRAFHDEIRPNRRNHCALLITSRINAPFKVRLDSLANLRDLWDVVVSRVPVLKTSPLRSRLGWRTQSQQTVEHSSNALVVATRRSDRKAESTPRGARPTPVGNGTSAAVASSSSVKSSNVLKNDKNTPPESLTLRLKKAETAVEVAAASLKSIRTLVEREGDDVLNQARQSHTEHLLKDLKKLTGSSAQGVDKP
jgi:hypothetical protein